VPIVAHRTACLIMALCGLAAFASPAAAVMPTRAGTIPPELAAGFDARLFDVPDHSGRITTSVAQAVWNIPVILVAFSDQPLSTTI
jgi:hypothetical protein